MSRDRIKLASDRNTDSSIRVTEMRVAHKITDSGSGYKQWWKIKKDLL